MTAPLTHTAPVPLPAMQEPGPAFVREAAAPAAQQAPADTSASAHGRGTDRSAAYPSAETAANTPDTAQETTHGLSGTGDSARNITPRTALPTDPAPAQGADSLAADTLYSGPQAADSLPFFSLEGPLRGTADTLWRDAPAEAVFGPASTLVPARVLPAAPAPSLTENPVFQGFVLLLAATYAILLYRFADSGQPDRNDSAGRRTGPQPAGDVCLSVRGAFPAGSRPAGRSRNALAALRLAADTAQTHLFHAGRHRHDSRPAALRIVPAGHGRRVVLHHCHRVARNGLLISQRDTESVSFQKNFDFALDFVPLHRGDIPNQPHRAACGKMIQ